MKTPTQITITINADDAEILAVLVKRFSYSDAERLACSNYPPSCIISAIVTLQSALSDTGNAPR